MAINNKPFGTFEGQNIDLFTITNCNGIEVSVMTYGATITSIKLPEGDNIVCGFNSFENYFSPEYISNSPYFGGMIGRYCATIQGGKYGDTELTKNAGGEHNLHGGVVGFDKRVWAATTIDTSAVLFSLLSVDGDQGFPGNVKANITVRLTDDNELVFHYEGETDKTTPLSMTNHTYYNLSGFAENVENHTVTINSDTTYAMDAKGVYGDNCFAVEGQPTDLRTARVIGDVHNELGAGFEHFYLFGELKSEPVKVAEICYPAKNRKLEVFTTEPGMLFYTAKYTSDELCRESGEQFGKHRAFCCESHRVPNGPNVEGAPYVFTSPCEKFDTTTIFKFTI